MGDKPRAHETRFAKSVLTVLTTKRAPASCRRHGANQRMLAGLAVLLAASSLAASPETGSPAPETQSAGTSPTPESPSRPLYTFTEEELGAYLAEIHESEPDIARRVVTIGRRNIGQPYEIYLLGEFPFEEHDPDPIYCLSRSDCLTFSEHTYAMALSSDWWGFMRALQRLRYRDGIIGMVTRNHYTVADWNRNNAYLFEDITAALGEGAAAVPLRQVCRRSRFFRQFGIGQDIPDEPIEDTYIPKERVPDVLKELRDADFVNIIRGDAESQWAGHTGLIALGSDGEVNFLHSARPAVREQPLVEYVESDGRCLGIKILRLRPSAERIMRETLRASAQATVVSAESMNAALAERRRSAPPTARPQDLDWMRASRLQSLRLDEHTPVDLRLQAVVEAIDRRFRMQWEIPEEERAFGVLDLRDRRLAMLRGDAMFYGASVPKICILLAYFQTQPDAVADLSEEMMRELGRMIKISDNVMAAKYGQLVGIEKIQDVLQSSRYGFYDKERQTGFWYGKHYGVAEPRFGDPVHDHSHAATVRQCLRYYLMLEQGRLVSAEASRRMKEIFAAPELEHADMRFVAGLQGRNLSLIRKSGTWEDWRLDTARVEHGDRAYLLAGMVHHPNGDGYLAAMAAAMDNYLCGPADRRPPIHQRVTHAGGDALARGSTTPDGAAHAQHEGLLLTCPPVNAGSNGPAAVTYTSPVIETDTLFNEALISFNVDAPPSVSFSVEGRVGASRDDAWSPFLRFAEWGASPPEGERIVECPQGRIDVDYFRSEERSDRFQYRIRAATRLLNDGGGDHAKLRIARVDVTLSDTTGRITSVPAAEPAAAAKPAAENWRKRLPVPFRSQKVERKEIAGRICSPTSVAMVLEYRGVTRPTQEVAERIHDDTHGIYGNWPNAVQAAYAYGVEGYLARFSDWREVERLIAAGQPLITSIRAEEGELANAPYRATKGHLLVLTGFDEQGNVEVNDPAASTAEKGRIAYARRDMEKVWMETKGGTAYILLPPADEAEQTPDPAADEPLVEITDVDPRIVIDLRYATENNFTGELLYPANMPCRLRESAARRLRRVQDELARRGLGLKVYDAYRPLSAQKKMWSLVPDPRYVADPEKGSRHNRGAAVDVTLVDLEGRELEMPTPYDDFTPAAHRNFTGGTEISRRNRAILQEVMHTEGFVGLETEWWHFDAPDWRTYPLVEDPSPN